MGLGFVLIFWAIAGLVLGTIGAGALGAITAFLTRGIVQSRRRLILFAGLFPFACLAWAGAVFVFQAVVNAGLLHRDVGLGDGSYAPLPNGYEISFIDVTDQGSICPVARGEDGCTQSPTAISGARSLQVAGYYLLGATDSQWFQHLGEQTSAVDQYFVLDTRDGKKTVFANLDQLKTKATELGISLQLEPIYSIYSRYRFTWFDILAGCLLVLPPIAALVALGHRIFRLRRTRATPASA
jgi:hypothetical protein